MMNLWTSEDIRNILLELEERKLPFSKYSFCQEEGELKLLGRGGSAEVYEAKLRSDQEKNFAIKVIGFRNQHADSAFFQESVEVQREIARFQDNVVKLYQHTELFICLDEEDHILSVLKESPKERDKKYIKLQFILMEKIPSVFSRTKAGNIRLIPESLKEGDGEEIFKLAYDIALALKEAHEKKVLHRDIKLENVFYSEELKQYKLGDFGIAKKTSDGFAETIALTNGYAAPEIRASDERYDYTADIYSFGIMLFVLTNNLKFPNSESYSVNSDMQYSPGYVLPKPELCFSEDTFRAKKAEELSRIIGKACRYDPNERYQSMGELISDLEKYMYGEEYNYKKEHKQFHDFFFFFFLLATTIAWKLTMGGDLAVSLSRWEALFCLMAVVKAVFHLFKMKQTLLNWGIFGVGVFSLISGGFSWIKCIILILVLISSGYLSAVIALPILTLTVSAYVEKKIGLTPLLWREYNWIAVSAFFLCLGSLLRSSVFIVDDRDTIASYQKFVVRLFPFIFFFLLLFYGFTQRKIMEIFGLPPENTEVSAWGKIMQFLRSVDFFKVGLLGLGFSFFFFLREKFLYFWRGKIERWLKNTVYKEE